MSVSILRYSAVCLMAGSFLSSSAAYADYNCTKSPDCASLGYTVDAADCDEGIKVLCPTDTSKAFCKTKPTCSGTIGDILFGDGSCSSEMISGKTPIGIVFDETNRLAVALTDVKEDGSAGSEYMHWSSSYCDIPDLTNCQYRDNDTSVDSCGVEGRTNTNAILATNGGCSGTTYAVNATNLYAPSGCSEAFCQKGQWFLPSMRDLAKIYANKSVINARLSLLNSFGAKTLTEIYYWSSGSYTEHYYWSSTEYDNNTAWKFTMHNGSRSLYDKDDDIDYVRPVVKY